MEEIKVFLKKLLADSSSKNMVFKRNILKEYLQIIVLDFIYSHPVYSQLVFYGGSCLAHCHGLPRLSEDLDFVDLKKNIELNKLAKDLEDYFAKNTDLKLKAVVQKFRVYLKFSLLHEMELAEKGESDLLFLKVEVFKGFDFCKNYKTETIPLFKFNRSILIKTFDLPTLMATKIMAVLHRKWEKTDKQGRTVASVKGRDYFDLMWYLEKRIRPNFSCLGEIKDPANLQKQLLELIEKVDEKSIRFDLEALIDNENFNDKISRDIKEILKRDIKKSLT